jgi:hypothetical protein
LSAGASALGGAWTKLGWANEHVQKLKARITEIRESVREAVRLKTTFDQERGEFVLEVVEAPRLPDDLNLVAGDAISNFRSALDHLAYQIVWKATGSYWDGSQWPILDKPRTISSVVPKNPDREPSIVGTLRRISTVPDLIAKVHRHQPYGSVDDYGVAGINHWDAFYVRRQNFILRTLRDMSNWDKHRLLLDPYLVPAGGSPKRFRPVADCSDVGLSLYASVVLKPGAKLAWFYTTVTGPNPQMEVDYDPRPEIGVGWDGEIGEVLDGIGAKVAQILSDFQPLV